jgi:hypothetical protein
MADLKIPISILALQAPELLQPWLLSRDRLENELLLFEGEIPRWLAAFCSARQQPIQSVFAGCLCCLGGPVLKTELIRAARIHRPKSVLIIAGVQAELTALADALQTPLVETAFKVDQLYWVSTFEQIDTNQANSELSRRQLDNLAACSTHVIVNPINCSVNVHSKVSELLDTRLLAIWSNECRFERKHVIRALGQSGLPANITFVFRSAREWYRLTGSDQLERSSSPVLEQSNWRINNQLICQQTALVEPEQVKEIIRQINDLGGISDSPIETQILSK